MRTSEWVTTGVKASYSRFVAQRRDGTGKGRGLGDEAKAESPCVYDYIEGMGKEMHIVTELMA